MPAPSETDPNDPLRWPTWKKHVAFTSVCAFTFLTNYAIGGLAPAFFILHLEFSRSMTETSHLLLYPILVLGLFNFFWVPLANYFGKRPIFVFASLLLCLCYIWGAVATSFKSLLWSNIIAAFAGSSTEALGAAMVNVSAGSLRPCTGSSGFVCVVLSVVTETTMSRICTICTNEDRKWGFTCALLPIGIAERLIRN